MDRIVECVPNFSEGRNQTTVCALVHAVESVPGVWLLDQTMDRDHHRSVLALPVHRMPSLKRPFALFAWQLTSSIFGSTRASIRVWGGRMSCLWCRYAAQRCRIVFIWQSDWGNE